MCSSDIVLRWAETIVPSVVKSHSMRLRNNIIDSGMVFRVTMMANIINPEKEKKEIYITDCTRNIFWHRGRMHNS